MSRSAFDQLLDYSHSIPTAVYEGKMWRSEEKIQEYKDGNYSVTTIYYYLHWWSASEDPNKCKHNRRKIKIIN